MSRLRPLHLALGMTAPFRRRTLESPSAYWTASSPPRLSEVLPGLEAEIARCRRYNRPFSVVVVDLTASSPDALTPTRDAWSAVRHMLRETDVAAVSADGERLLVFCPETNGEGARLLLHRFVERLGSLSTSRHGLASFVDDGFSLEGLIHQAIEEADRRSALLGHAVSNEAQDEQVSVPVLEQTADPAIVRAPWLTRFPLRRKRPGRIHRAVKRGFDLLVLTITAPAWAPVLATSMGLIKLSSPRAPVFFRQQRTGKDGKRFAMYKLRTMVPDAEHRKPSLAHLNELVWPDFKITNDPRVTRIGRFLRRSSLDELAQVINVLRAEMSLVGPRPTSFAADTYDVWHTRRLDVTPGLTGLWQVAGRASTLFDDRLRLEIAYLKRESLLLDLEILRRTVFAIVRQDGAS